MMQRSEIADEWRLEGAIEQTKRAIRKFARGRGGVELPHEITELIDAQDDMATLDRWIGVVAEATSLDDFRARITASTNGS